MENLKNMLLSASQKKAGNFNIYFKNEMNTRIKDKLDNVKVEIKEDEKVEEALPPVPDALALGRAKPGQLNFNDYKFHAVNLGFDKYLTVIDYNYAVKIKASLDDLERWAKQIKKENISRIEASKFKKNVY